MNTYGSKTEPKAAPMKPSQNRSKEHAWLRNAGNGLHHRVRESLQNQARVVITITWPRVPVRKMIIYISPSFRSFNQSLFLYNSHAELLTFHVPGLNVLSLTQLARRYIDSALDKTLIV